MLAKLLERTDRERFSPIVVSMLSENTVVAPRIEAAGVPVHTLGLHRGIPSPAGVTRLATIIRKFRPDVLQAWMYHANLLGLLAGRMTRVPSLIWNIRSSDLDLQSVHRSLRVVIKAHASLARFPDTVVINSASGIPYHESLGHHPRRWKLISNGFDLEHFVASPTRRAEGRARLSVDAGATVIGMVARLHPQKDHQTFISAAQILQQTHPAVVFVLAGTGLTPENETLVEQLKQANVWQNTRLLGEVADTSSLFPSLDINTLSSAYGEGFPNALGEAMSCEVPCVATDVGDSARLLADTGRIVAPRSPEAIAAGWRELIEMGSGQLHALGAAARARVQAQFSLQGIVAEYEGLYTDAVGRAGASQGLRR